MFFNRNFLVFILVLSGSLTIHSVAQNQSPEVLVTSFYESFWEEVIRAEQASLPQTAAEKVDTIYQRALTEKNSPELIKSLMYKMKYVLATDKDRFPQLLSEIGQYTENNKDTIERSVLYSILAQLYMKYYSSRSYEIDGRTAVTGYIPEDIREWTGNIFFGKISEYVNLSLTPKKKLQSVGILKYENILVTGKSSRDFRPTIYDFIANQGIALLNQSLFAAEKFFYQSKFPDDKYLSPVEDFIRMPVTAEQTDWSLQILKIYQDLLSFRLEQKEEDALLLADLDRLSFVYGRIANTSKDALYMNVLESLEKKYAGKDICVEILHKRALQYLSQGDSEVVSSDSEDAGKKRNEYKVQAYRICVDGIRKYPGYKRIGLLKSLEEQLTQPYVRIQADNNIYPGKPLKLSVGYQNINKLTVKIYRMNIPVTDYENIWNMSGKYHDSGTLIETKTFSMKNDFPYLGSDTVFEIPVKELGGYEYVIYADDNPSGVANQYFSVSRLTSVARAYDNQYEFLVVDRISGKPVEGADVNLYRRIKNKNELQKSVKSGKDGLVSVEFGNEKRMDFYSITMGNDKFLMFSSVPWSNDFYIAGDPAPQLTILTDRSIYRPGQVVYFKGIAYELQKDSAQVSGNRECILSLRDSNGQEIASKTFRTSEMGSFSGEFILPYGLVNGSFSIAAKDYTGKTFFRVEEYKRPGFDIIFEPVKETYSFGDRITVKGETRTFSGVNLQNTKVRYRIVQRQNRLYRWNGTETQIAEGFVLTGSDGKFSVSFTAEKDLNGWINTPLSSIYQVEVSVTDDKGETQHATTYVPVGSVSMQLTMPALETPVDKDNLPEFVVFSRNPNDQEVNSKGSYEIYSLKGEESLENSWNQGDLKPDKLIVSGNFVSGEKIPLDILKKVKSGRYRMTIKANDDKGCEIPENIPFLVYSGNDKQPPVSMYEWVLYPKSECNIGETTNIVYGSSAKNVYVLYEIFKDGKKIEISRFELNNSMKKLPVTFRESYGDGIVVSLTFIKNGRLFTKNFGIKKAKPKKELEVKMEVFRDKLIPGQKEEWKISVKDVDKRPVVSELLASMYDASLDKIYPHGWNFYPKVNISLFQPYSLEAVDFRSHTGYIGFDRIEDPVPELSFDEFNWFGLNMYGRMLLHNRSVQAESPPADYSAGIANSELSEVVVVGMATAKKSMTTGSVAALKEDIGNANDEFAEPVQIRKNLNETAFFYPQLRTNASGETLISFTVPESNTTWKLMALAHTKDLKYGQVIEKAISRKKLMVNPNMPRFMRHRDKTTLTTAISNLSDQTISGKVVISFFDPATGKENIVVADAQKDFSAASGKTTTVSWTFEVPAGVGITACKIVATAGDFSDGEQHLLPVLPNRMMVTESLPLFVSGKGNKQFTLDKLVNNQSASLENYRLTLEFADNPVWYAVQALPAMTVPANDDVISWFAAYYANNMAISIVNNTPGIKQVIDVWTKQGGSKESLLSNLEKNRELKAVLLEETPWLLEGKNEREQKQRLGLLFDVNRSANLSRDAVSKLKELQREDGGWAWFKGMNSSVSVTQWLLYGMAKLSGHPDIEQNLDVRDMQKNAIGFIDDRFVENFENLKKYDKNWEKKNTVSTYEIEYLLVRSLYPEMPKTDKVDESIGFYRKIAVKNWTKIPNLYDRAIIALFLSRTGEIDVAKAIVASLRQHAQQKEEMGMYWPNNTTKSFMFQSATAIHTFIMEAFEKTGASEKEVNALKLWLLKQKQTQEWESTPATVNAVSVLLQTGSNWLENKGQTAISLGKINVEPESKETGTGYFKRSYDSQSITPDMGQVSLSKPDNGPAWGALYWQYFDDLDWITKSKAGLNVEKLLFKEEIAGSGKVLVPVTDENPLRTGDKVVVRLTVHNDKDMEYVLLKDMRAACFEPVEQVSGIRWKEQTVCYQTSKDASTSFYFYNLPKGTYVFEYPVYVTRAGEYSNGITTIQSMYAPEFVSNTEGMKIIVKSSI